MKEIENKTVSYGTHDILNINCQVVSPEKQLKNVSIKLIMARNGINPNNMNLDTLFKRFSNDEMIWS